MSRLCRLKTASHGDDGKWAYNEIVSLRKQRDELLAACDALLEWDFVRGFRLPYKVRDPIIAAIVSVKGEQ